MSHRRLSGGSLSLRPVARDRVAMSIVVVGAKIQEREESKDLRDYSAWRSHDRDPHARLCDDQ